MSGERNGGNPSSLRDRWEKASPEERKAALEGAAKLDRTAGAERLGKIDSVFDELSETLPEEEE